MASARHYTDLEFVVRWRDRTREFLPAPLLYISKSRTGAEHARLVRDELERMRAHPDQHADEVVETMAHADIRVVVYGCDEKKPDAPDPATRLLGVRKGDRGFTIAQIPAETAWHTDGYLVRECTATGLAEALVGQLPEVPAGRLGDIVLPSDTATTDLDYSYHRSRVFDSFDDGITQRARRFHEAAASASGSISIVQGTSRFGPRGITRHKLRWRDLDDDGRYVITPTEPPVAMAADAKRMVTLINQQIAEVVRAIKDDRR